jgi:hypothetical protein
VLSASWNNLALKTQTCVFLYICDISQFILCSFEFLVVPPAVSGGRLRSTVVPPAVSWWNQLPILVVPPCFPGGQYHSLSSFPPLFSGGICFNFPLIHHAIRVVYFIPSSFPPLLARCFVWNLLHFPVVLPWFPVVDFIPSSFPPLFPGGMTPFLCRYQLSDRVKHRSPSDIARDQRRNEKFLLEPSLTFMAKPESAASPEPESQPAPDPDLTGNKQIAGALHAILLLPAMLVSRCYLPPPRRRVAGQLLLN